MGKLIVAKGFQKLPKVQKIAQSGHTGWRLKLKSSFLKRDRVEKNFRRVGTLYFLAIIELGYSASLVSQMQNLFSLKQSRNNLAKVMWTKDAKMLQSLTLARWDVEHYPPIEALILRPAENKHFVF